ncbi:hypothetical protein HGRIS_000371 [Hohenbuehelia grisea]|uniref:Uncharacterized protein n=1 Tax=Hohenbuehelia grisea TaxID=104357 RepID=A0ABR3JSQ8_9AGAR
MALQAGVYSLTQSPLREVPRRVGGMFVSANGTNSPIITAARVPAFFNKQSWRIQPVEGRDNRYKIIFQTDNKMAPVGFGLENPNEVQAGDDVLLTVSPIDWVINLVKPENTPDDKTFVEIKACNHENLVVTVGNENTLQLVDKPAVAPFFYASKQN